MRTDSDTDSNLRVRQVVVMAIVPDARPQDADRGQIEFLLNCSGCDWMPPQILAVELKQVERAMSRAGDRAVASD